MKLKKKIQWVLFAFALLFACAAAAGFSENVRASGATEGFYMEEGASVRTVPSSTGLRFRALMDKEEYAALKEKESSGVYAEVSFGMLIVPQDYQESAPLTAVRMGSSSCFRSSSTTLRTTSRAVSRVSGGMTPFRLISVDTRFTSGCTESSISG